MFGSKRRGKDGRMETVQQEVIFDYGGTPMSQRLRFSTHVCQTGLHRPSLDLHLIMCRITVQQDLPCIVGTQSRTPGAMVELFPFPIARPPAHL